MAPKTRITRIMMAMLLAAAVLQPLAACGKKARPLPPPDSTYPQSYPAPS